jgi:hypothetical protein
MPALAAGSSPVTHSMSWNNVSGPLKAQLLRNIPARILPQAGPGSHQRHQVLYDSGVWVAGPIVKDKIWFSTSFHYQKIRKSLGSFNPDGTQVPDDNDLLNNSNKLAWQMTKSSQLTVLHHSTQGERPSRQHDAILSPARTT